MARKLSEAPLRRSGREAASNNDTANYARVGIPFAAARQDRWRLMGRAASALHKMTPAYRRGRAEIASWQESLSDPCEGTLFFRQESHRYNGGRDSSIYIGNSPRSLAILCRQSIAQRVHHLSRQIQVVAGWGNADMPRRTHWPLFRCR